jgi:hypothetical protein
MSPLSGHEGGRDRDLSVSIGLSQGNLAIASTRSIAVMAASASAKVSTRKPRVIVKLEDQRIRSPIIPASNPRLPFNDITKTEETRTTSDPITSIRTPSHR